MSKQHNVRAPRRARLFCELGRHAHIDLVHQWKARSRSHALAAIDDHSPHAQLARIQCKRHRDLARSIDHDGLRRRKTLEEERGFASFTCHALDARRLRAGKTLQRRLAGAQVQRLVSERARRRSVFIDGQTLPSIESRDHHGRASAFVRSPREIVRHDRRVVAVPRIDPLHEHLDLTAAGEPQLPCVLVA